MSSLTCLAEAFSMFENITIPSPHIYFLLLEMYYFHPRTCFFIFLFFSELGIAACFNLILDLPTFHFPTDLYVTVCPGILSSDVHSTWFLQSASYIYTKYYFLYSTVNFPFFAISSLYIIFH